MLSSYAPEPTEHMRLYRPMCCGRNEPKVHYTFDLEFAMSKNILNVIQWKTHQRNNCLIYRFKPQTKPKRNEI